MRPMYVFSLTTEARSVSQVHEFRRLEMIFIWSSTASHALTLYVKEAFTLI